MKQLFIENKKVLLDENTYFPFTYKISDLENVNIINLPKSKTINIPRCPQNDEIFGHIGEITRINVNSNDNKIGISFNQIKKCEYKLCNESVVIGTGLLIVNAVNEKNYEIQLYDYLVKKLEEIEGDEETQEYYLNSCPILQANGQVMTSALDANFVAGANDDSGVYGLKPIFNNKKDTGVDNDVIICSLFDGTGTTAGYANLPTDLTALQLRTYKNWMVDWAFSIKNVINSINYKYPNTFSYDNKLEQLFRETFIMSQAPTTEDRSVSTFIQSAEIDGGYVSYTGGTNNFIYGLSNVIKDSLTGENICIEGGHKYMELYYTFEFKPIWESQIIGRKANLETYETTEYTLDTPDGTDCGKIYIRNTLMSSSGLYTSPVYNEISLIKNKNFFIQTGLTSSGDTICTSATVEAKVSFDVDFYPKFYPMSSESTTLKMELNYDVGILGSKNPVDPKYAYTVLDAGYIVRIRLNDVIPKRSELTETNLEFRTNDIVKGENLYPKVSIKDFVINLAKFYNLDLEIKNDSINIKPKEYYIAKNENLLIDTIENIEVNNITFNRLRLINTLPKSDILDSYKKKYKKTYGSQIISTGYSIKNNIKDITTDIAIPFLMKDFNAYGYDKFLGRFWGGYSKTNHGVVDDLDGKLVFGYLNRVNEVMYVSDDYRKEGKMLHETDFAVTGFSYGDFCDEIPFPPEDVKFCHTNFDIQCDTRLDEWDPMRFKYLPYDKYVLYGTKRLNYYYTFSPFYFDDNNEYIIKSLEFGKSEVNYAKIPDDKYLDTSTLYYRHHRNMLIDKYSHDTHIIDCNIWIDGVVDIRKIYNYHNSFYIISEIVEYDPTTPGIYEVKLMRVNDYNNYINNKYELTEHLIQENKDYLLFDDENKIIIEK